MTFIDEGFHQLAGLLNSSCLMRLRWKSPGAGSTRMLIFLTSLCLFWAMGAIRAEAAPLGAAISWVPFDNRGDFQSDKPLIRELIETHFFGISPENHIALPTNASFRKTANGPSFEVALDQSIQKLLRQMDAKSEPYLAVVISSHGGVGCLAHQSGQSTELSDFSRLLLSASEKFQRHSGGRELRLEILYSACHSGSLISEMRKEIKRVRSKNPVSILTSTNENLVSYASTYFGDYLLKWIHSFGVAGREIGQETSWSEFRPTLAQFGFFNHIGQGQSNFPQSYSTHFSWSSQNTLNFLEWRLDHDGSSNGGISLWERQLDLDVFPFIENSTTVSATWQLLLYENWNRKLEREPEAILKYLHHTKSHIRLAAAIHIVDAVGSRFHRSQSLRPYLAEAKQILSTFWIDTDNFGLLGEQGADLASLVLQIAPDVFQNVPLSVVVEWSKKLSDKNSVFNSFLKQNLRSIFLKEYNVAQTKREDLMRPKPPAPLNLKLVPESLKFLFLKVYWNLPMSTPDEDVLAKVKAAAVGERSVFGALAGPGCDRLLLGQSELDAWTSLVIRVFDAHSSGR